MAGRPGTNRLRAKAQFGAIGAIGRITFPNMHVREATEADDFAVGELLVRAFAAQYARLLPEVVMHPERLADLRNQAEKRADSTVPVAESVGKIVGTVALYRSGAPRSEAWIPGAADLRLPGVDVDHQGQGISGALLNEAEWYAREWNVPAICLHVRRGAAGAARLCVARGYVPDRSGDLDRLPLIFLEGYALRLSG